MGQREALILAKDEIAEWCKLGRVWGGRQENGSASSPPEAIRTAYDSISKDYWQPLIACVPNFSWKNFTPWGRYAFALLVIADEASRDLGYQLDDETLAHPIEQLMRDLWVHGGSTRAPIDSDFPWHERATKNFPNFATVANGLLYRVVPKSRTPFVGNTMRTLSHNLALVPPIGGVDLNWHRELRAFKENREPLNLLLVPFPYRISARCFVPQKGHARNEIQQDQWSCMFDVHQRWLTQNGEHHDDATSNNNGSQSKIVEFIAALIDQSQREVPKLHGLLLPELAFDWDTYHELVKKLINDANESGRSPRREALDFIVCGSLTDWGDGKGNFVLVTTFSTNNDGKSIATTYSQSKHHRWRLTESQISGYGLSASLDPHVVWWEGIELPRREVGLSVFRRGSIFAAMICEDLARSEPCHEPLKSVGPNLIFALLMDGPQLPHRWSARYATSLADDPGSSVLTLTSLGLIERVNSAGAFKECRNISLWKDDTGRTVEISCPRDA